MVRVAFLGDIALFADETLSGNWQLKFHEVARVLAKYDLVVANLEAPITNCNHTMVCKGIHLKTTSAIIDVLKMLNVGIVSLSNNHACDFGIKGLADTIQALNKAGIKYYGVNGKSETIIIKGERFVFHGYCCYSANGAHYTTKDTKYGIHALTAERILTDLKSDKALDGLSVLSLHWGDEYSSYPNKRQVKLMHELTKNYKFILHGHHTHAMQGIEYINSSLLMYSQGNFCFDEVHSTVNKKQCIKQNEINRESYILSADIENSRINQWNTVGVFNSEEKVRLLDNAEKIKSLSECIQHCEEDQYEMESKQMIARQKTANLGKKDFWWLMSKMNYYSIGAKILYYRNKRLYNKAF